MTREEVRLFGIETIENYLDFCAQAVAEFEKDQASVLRGFTAILSLNHITDWLQYKLTAKERQGLGIADACQGHPVMKYFEDQNEDLRRVRSIANGFKHLRPVHSTERIAGFGRGPYGIGPFGMPYLLIDLGDHLPPAERWDVGFSLCRRVLEWWRKRLSNIVRLSEGEGA
jgi:hypothetical protein